MIEVLLLILNWALNFSFFAVMGAVIVTPFTIAMWIITRES